jgi:hypothetical protein
MKMNETDKPTPMMQQYLEVRRGLPRDTLLLFRLGDFYEMFFDDAVAASRLLGLTLTKRQGNPMAGIPYHAVDTYVGKLLAGRGPAGPARYPQADADLEPGDNPGREPGGCGAQPLPGRNRARPERPPRGVAGYLDRGVQDRDRQPDRKSAADPLRFGAR